MSTQDVIFTRDTVTEVLTKMVAEAGRDHVYRPDRRLENGKMPFGQSCFYTPQADDPTYDAETGAGEVCIVGGVVRELAPDLFKQIGEWEAASGTSCGADELLSGRWEEEWDTDLRERIFPHEDDALTEDPALIAALTRAQRVQDHGGTWGKALDAYTESLKDSEEFEAAFKAAH